MNANYFTGGCLVIDASHHLRGFIVWRWVRLIFIEDLCEVNSVLDIFMNVVFFFLFFCCLFFFFFLGLQLGFGKGNG
jgi:hypothetical protein